MSRPLVSFHADDFHLMLKGPTFDLSKPSHHMPPNEQKASLIALQSEYIPLDSSMCEREKLYV